MQIRVNPVLVTSSYPERLAVIDRLEPGSAKLGDLPFDLFLDMYGRIWDANSELEWAARGRGATYQMIKLRGGTVGIEQMFNIELTKPSAATNALGALNDADWGTSRTDLGAPPTREADAVLSVVYLWSGFLPRVRYLWRETEGMVTFIKGFDQPPTLHAWDSTLSDKFVEAAKTFLIPIYRGGPPGEQLQG